MRRAMKSETLTILDISTRERRGAAESPAIARTL